VEHNVINMAWIIWNNGIGVNECESIIKQYKDFKLEDAKAGGESENKNLSLYNVPLRNSLICWINENTLLTRALFQFLLEANDTKFKYNIFNCSQSVGYDAVQFARYNEGGFYHWHQDTVPFGQVSNNDKINRKISLTLNLSDPKSYDGGDLEFFQGEHEPTTLNKREQGSVVCFDSYDWHRITPVTRGVRYSLVLWIWGPDFV